MWQESEGWNMNEKCNRFWLQTTTYVKKGQYNTLGDLPVCGDSLFSN